MNLGDFATSAVVYSHYTTRSTSGLPQTVSSVTLKVYKDDSSTTEVTTGVTHNEDFDGIVGLNQYKVDLSSDTSFYAAGHDYTVVMTAGTIDGSSMAGEVIDHFSINNRFSSTAPTAAQVATAVWTDTTAGDFTVSASIGKSVLNGVALGTGLTINAYTGNTPQTGDAYAIVNSSTFGNAKLVRATTPANTLDISATGEAGIDWANVGSPTTTVGLTNTTISTTQAVASVSGSVGSLASQAKTDVENSVWDGLTSAHSTAGSFGLLVKTDLDDTITSRMASYTQPTGFLAATFPTTIASTTNITAGTVTTVSGNVTGSVGSLAFQAKLDVENSVWDATLTSGSHSNADSSGLALRRASVLVQVEAAVSDLTPAADAFTTTLTSLVNDFYHDQTILFTSGTLAGQSAVIFTYDGSTKEVTFDEPFTSAPANGDTFVLLTTQTHPITQISAANWDTLAVDHNSPGTMGFLMNNVASSVNPWVANLPASYVSGQAGYIVGTFLDRAVSQAKLGTDGLDAIPTTAPTGVASSFREMVVQLWRRFFKKTTKNDSGDGSIKTYADNNVTVTTTQGYIETASSQQVDEAV